MFGVILAAAFLGGLAFFALRENKREVLLVNGALYAVSFRTNAPGFDVSMFPGFCNFSEPVANFGNGFYEVQFTANWCAANTLWTVPSNVAIAEL